MAKVWKITAHEVEHMGGGPPLKEYYLVAMSDQFAAMSALRKRPTLRDADLTVVGEASPDDVEWLDVKDGEIFCVMPIFMTARQKRTPKRKPQRRMSTLINPGYEQLKAALAAPQQSQPTTQERAASATILLP